MHALVLLCINQYTKFEVPSFTNCKDMVGQNLKKTILTTPLLGVVCHHRRRAFNTLYQRTKCDDFSFSRSKDINGDVKNQSGSRN